MITQTWVKFRLGLTVFIQDLLVVEKDGEVDLETGWSYHALLVGGGGAEVILSTQFVFNLGNPMLTT